MRLTIDSDRQQLLIDEGQGEKALPLYSKEAYERLSRWWVRMGWANKISYDYTWLGRPIIQLPEDLVRLQELVFTVKPDLIIETGVAHGGSAIFFASMLQLLGGDGRVVSVDIEIRPHNRAAIEAHPMFPRITLIEGSSTAPETVAQVKRHVKPGAKVLVILDSNHTKKHVADELELYAPLVTKGSYIVATDGIMLDLYDVPGGKPEWKHDHPTAAAAEFAAKHREFTIDPHWTRSGVTYFPGAYLKRS